METLITKQTIEKSPFIVANTSQVTMDHLRDDCIIPVFAKDNETTISHHQFIDRAMRVAGQLFPDHEIKQPEVRVSHVIKGRIPSAIGKPVKELLENEKTIYYERCAFLIEIPGITEIVNGNRHSLSLGGVRAYNQENLYSNKSLERFKMFLGFKNHVCMNLCISTDGVADEVRISSIDELEEQIYLMASSWDRDEQVTTMKSMGNYFLTEKQFAHLIGKLKIFLNLTREEKKNITDVAINDSQINSVIRGYVNDDNFSRGDDGMIDLYSLYNLFTGANKSSYIDQFLERGVFAYGFVKELCDSLESNQPNWFLNN